MEANNNKHGYIGAPLPLKKKSLTEGRCANPSTKGAEAGGLQQLEGSSSYIVISKLASEHHERRKVQSYTVRRMKEICGGPASSGLLLYVLLLDTL